MTWTSGLPLGLLKQIRTFTLSPKASLTHLTVKEEARGAWAAVLRNASQDTAQFLNDYVRAVAKSAELLDRVS